MQTDVSTDLWLIYGGSSEHGVMRELGLGLCTITIDRAGREFTRAAQGVRRAPGADVCGRLKCVYDTARLAGSPALVFCPNIARARVGARVTLQRAYVSHRHQSDGRRYVPSTSFDDQMSKTAIPTPRTCSRSPPRKFVPN